MTESGDYPQSSIQTPDEKTADDLKKLKQWICWKKGEVRENGKFTKVPCTSEDPHYSVSAQNSSYHLSYKDACWADSWYVGIGGIGFVPSRDDPYCFFDLDDCVDNETGEVMPWAVRLLEKLDSFAYWTPSGKGFRIVVLGKLHDGGGYYVYEDEEGKHLLEVYDRDHLLTFTKKSGNKPIREAQGFLDNLKKTSMSTGREDLGYEFPEVDLGEDLEVIRKEVKSTLASHDLNPDPIMEGLRKSTLISIGAHLIMDGKPKDWLWDFLNKINATLLYNKAGNLEGLDDDELKEVFSANMKLEPKVSSEEVQRCLDTMQKFLNSIKPYMKRPFDTDWNFLKALEIQGRKYGNLVEENKLRVDGSWLTLMGLARLSTPKTVNRKICRLKESGIIEETGKDKGDRSGHFIMNIEKLLSGEHFGFPHQTIESMGEDSNVMNILNNNTLHYSTISTHTSWIRQHGNAKNALYAALYSLGGGARISEIAKRMKRVDDNGNAKCGSISGILRECVEVDKTLNNPRRGYYEFAEDFDVKLDHARANKGEFVRDEGFKEYKEKKREKYKESMKSWYAETKEQRDLFYKILPEIAKENPELHFILSIDGAYKPMVVLGKYFVEEDRVTGIVGLQT